ADALLLGVPDVAVGTRRDTDRTDVGDGGIEAREHSARRHARDGAGARILVVVPEVSVFAGDDQARLVGCGDRKLGDRDARAVAARRAARPGRSARDGSAAVGAGATP